MKYPHLFSPIQIRGLELKNRVMISGMVTKMSKERRVTQELINYHVARAEGGLGLNFLEATAVHEPSSIDLFLSIGKDEYIEGLKELTKAVHKAGGKIGIQLWQGGLVAPVLDPKAEAVIPSEVSMQVTVVSGADNNIKFPAAGVEKIHEVTAAFGSAAKRAVEAGFDCVEVHIAHGYSTHAFLSPAFNHRTDEYGGSLENRARFPLECIEAVRRNIPDSMPLFIRVVAQDDLVENGLTRNDIIRFCNMAKARGVDAVDVSRGNSFTAGHLESAPVDYPRGFNVANAAEIKKGTGLTTIAVGRINSPEQAEKIIADNQADMVVMGRAHIADPQFCNKAKSGNETSIVRCVGCNQGCNDIVATLEKRHITCLMNPAVGREKEFSVHQTKAPKKVLIIGGGIAGIYAATMLKERGHRPILIEKSPHLGGQFYIAGEAPKKAEFKSALEYRIQNAINMGVDIHLNTPFSSNLLERFSPDEVIIATGAIPITPPIPTEGNTNVFQAWDILTGKAEIKGTAIVVGGGLVGVEVAEYLAEKRVNVIIIEMLDAIAKDMGPSRKTAVMDTIASENISAYISTKCLKILPNKVIAEKDGTQLEFPCNAVVLAVGARPAPSEEIIQLCKQKHIPFHIIGDAKKTAKALDAVAAAADTVLAIEKESE